MGSGFNAGLIGLLGLDLRGIIFLFILALCTPYPSAAEWDNEYWNFATFRHIKTDEFQLATFTHFRLTDDWGQLGVYQLTERFIFTHNKEMPLQLNLSYVGVRTTNQRTLVDEFANQIRPEFEINPMWELAPTLWLRTRNRLEARFSDDLDFEAFRLRNRFTLEKELSGCLSMSAVLTRAETFFDFDRGVFNQLRLGVIGFRFRDPIPYAVVWQVAATRTGDNWSPATGLITEFEFDVS